MRDEAWAGPGQVKGRAWSGTFSGSRLLKARSFFLCGRLFLAYMHVRGMDARLTALLAEAKQASHGAKVMDTCLMLGAEFGVMHTRL